MCVCFCFLSYSSLLIVLYIRSNSILFVGLLEKCNFSSSLREAQFIQCVKWITILCKMLTYFFYFMLYLIIYTSIWKSNSISNKLFYMCFNFSCIGVTINISWNNIHYIWLSYKIFLHFGIGWCSWQYLLSFLKK